MGLTEPVTLSLSEKQQILDELLRSPVFGRSEQLRQMLRYLVQEEVAGRGSEICEYAIGVEALGRPAGYSPEVDSTVRTRAHELRKRIEEHYRGHPPETDTWRLELPKGTYQPRFVKADVHRSPEPSQPVVEKETFLLPANPLRGARTFGQGVLAGVAGVLLLLGAGWGVATLLRSQSAEERAVRDIWGPAAARGSTTTLVLATPMQLWVRQFLDVPTPVLDPPFTLPVPDSPVFAEWFKRSAQREPRALLLHPNNHSPLWGDAAGAAALVRFLTARGVRTELLGEPNVRAATLKDRNGIVIGRADYSMAVGALEPANGYSVRYVPEQRGVGVVEPGGKVAFLREKGGRINYGLATFLTRRTADGERRTVLFSGINSDGAQAAVEYVTSPRTMIELQSRLRAGKSEMPASFQVVVRTMSSDTFTLQAQAVAHRILD
jgi:hypothetical protein